MYENTVTFCFVWAHRYNNYYAVNNITSVVCVFIYPYMLYGQCFDIYLFYVANWHRNCFICNMYALQTTCILFM